MHPKPVEDDRPSSSSGSHKSEASITKENGNDSKAASGGGTGEQKIVDDLVDTNLIQLDTWVTINSPSPPLKASVNKPTIYAPEKQASCADFLTSLGDKIRLLL